MSSRALVAFAALIIAIIALTLPHAWDRGGAFGPPAKCSTEREDTNHGSRPATRHFGSNIAGSEQ